MKNVNSPQFDIYHRINNTSVPYQDNMCLHEMLEYQTKLRPDKKAICYKEQFLTYSKLDLFANAIANVLLSKNIAIEDYVIVYLDRRLELIPSIFGILKSGGVYVPVTSSTPKNRILSIVEDTQAKVIITSTSLVDNLPICECKVILVDDIFKNLDTLDQSQPKIKVNSKNLAYAIFTSGTSGKPKGVLIEHHSVFNRIGWMQKKYPIDSDDVLIQKTPISFDVSIWELFWWTFTGARLILLENEYEKDPLKLIECINKEKVSVVHFVPSMLNTFLMYLNNSNSNQISKFKFVKWLFCSGEELYSRSVSDFYKVCNQYNFNTTVINLYGPTEATIDVTYHTCSRDFDAPIPIGKPIDNTEIFIVNSNNEILPSNIEGELVICGVNVSRGYLNRPEITKERFISFKKLDGETVMAYKTGDYALIDSGGEIIFKGRIDGQIKLRGNRIELADIESVLIKFKGIGECACVLKDKDKESAHIIAFIKTNEIIDNNELNNFLSHSLPSYMIPSKYVAIEHFPLSANGKLDRNKLLIDNTQIQNKEVELISASNYERVLQKIWGQLFSKPKISPVINFFELGGNSLLLVQTSLLIRKELDIDIDVITLMQYPTIRLLAEHMLSIQ